METERKNIKNQFNKKLALEKTYKINKTLGNLKMKQTKKKPTKLIKPNMKRVNIKTLTSEILRI